MILDDDRSYYDLLEITPDASPQDIRSAYLRSKAAYRKDSVALYTLISQEETEDLLRKIEEAYQVLSSPERRREYDRSHGLLTGEEPSPVRSPGRNQKIVSIDRVPPMEDLRGDMSILVAPSTDFTSSGKPPASTPSTSMGAGASPFDTQESSIGTMEKQAPPSFPGDPGPSSFAPAAPKLPQAALRHPTDQFHDQALAQEILDETEWRGPFLRKVREARNIAIEELSEYTKISKTYLLAIEEENYSRLPAAVYLRGFVTQVSKYLRLPADKVAASYVARVNQARLEKEKSGTR